MTDTASPFRVQIFRKNLRPKSDRLLASDNAMSLAINFVLYCPRN
jgi:hypothetical protein